MQGARFELANPYGTGPSSHYKISEKTLNKYISLIEVEGKSKTWIKRIEKWLKEYLNYLNWNINEDKTLRFLKLKKKKYHVETYRKMVFQIRKFLYYLDTPWAKNIKLPPEPDYTPQRITKDDIRKTIEYFQNHQYFPQLKALILLGSSSGLRAEEIYQLKPENIDLERRIVYVVHDPQNGKTTKTGKSRISFFNEEAQKALKEYFQFFKGSGLRKLFGKTHLEEIFKDAPIRVKDLRKFFSQEWERMNGSYAVKELLLGHSTKGKVDLQHYTYLSPEDLKEIYDRVGIKILS